MSIEELHTQVIRCDGRGCNEAYMEPTEVKFVENLRNWARRDGWEESESGSFHFCPDCKAKRQAKRVARAVQQGIVEAMK